MITSDLPYHLYDVHAVTASAKRISNVHRDESFCKSYIYLLHVGKYSRQMLSVKLPASCLSLHAKPS